MIFEKQCFYFYLCFSALQSQALMTKKVHGFQELRPKLSRDRRKETYRNTPKFWDTQEIAVIILNYE